MARNFRTEDEAINFDHSATSFSGPHFHVEHPRDENGEFTRETVMVPCTGCWS
jgi:hypothetical protein